MEQKVSNARPILKTILNNPLKNMPAVPIPDWSNLSNMGPSTSTNVTFRTTADSVNTLIPNSQKNDLQSTVTLQNCVATLSLGCELNLQTITFRTRNSEYNPSRFQGVIMRIREPRTTALIFKSGKIVVTGARNEDNALLASKKYARIIQKLGFNIRATDFRIQNIVATCDLRFPIKLENLNMIHGQFSSYEPEIFPGLIYRMIKPRLVLLIFVNGKIVFTGAKSRQDLKEALDNMYPILKSFRKN